MAWTIHQRPRYSRLRRIVLIHIPPPSQVIAVILTNTELEKKILTFSYQKGQRKFPSYFLLLWLYPGKDTTYSSWKMQYKRKSQNQSCIPTNLLPMSQQCQCTIGVKNLCFPCLLLNMLITHLGPAQTHLRFTLFKILNHFKAEPFWQIFWNCTDTGWSLACLLHIHIR